MPRGSTPIGTSRFQGLYDRGSLVPRGHLSVLENMIFEGDLMKKRGGFNRLSQSSRLYTRFLDVLPGEKISAPVRVFSTGEMIYAGLAEAGPFDGATDFSALNMKKRYYLTPHNRNTGRGQVQVYDGSTIRPICGEGPPEDLQYTATSNFLPILEEDDVAPATYLDIGRYIMGVSYQIDNYITRPGYIRSFYVEDTTNNSLKLLNIPNITQSYVSDIVIIMTRLFIPNEGDENNNLTTNRAYANNYKSYTFYFVPFGKAKVESGEIRDRDNNAVSELRLPFAYDTDDYNKLIASNYFFFSSDLLFNATYLIDQLTSMPGGVGLCDYNNRLVVWNGDRVWVSRAQEPESFGDLTGFKEVGLEDPSTIKNCFAYKDNLYILKSNSTYVTTDNGEEVNTWKVINVDRGYGGEVHSIGQIRGFQGPEKDYVFVANKHGLSLFNGATYSDIEASWKIQNLWDKITDYSSLQVVLDPTNERVYILCTIDDEAVILLMDYQKGLFHEDGPRGGVFGGPRWSVIKKLGSEIVSIGMSDDNDLLAMTSGSDFSEVLSISDRTNDVDRDQTLAIRSKIALRDFRLDESLGILHYGEGRVRVRGEGILSLTCEGLTLMESYSYNGFVTLKYRVHLDGTDLEFTLKEESLNGSLDLLEFLIFTKKVWL